MWCELHLLSVSVRNSCLKTARQDAEQTWADLGLQLSGVCGLRGEEEEEKSNNPNLKGGEQAFGVRGVAKTILFTEVGILLF